MYMWYLSSSAGTFIYTLESDWSLTYINWISYANCCQTESITLVTIQKCGTGTSVPPLLTNGNRNAAFGARIDEKTAQDWYPMFANDVSFHFFSCCKNINAVISRHMCMLYITIWHLIYTWPWTLWYDCDAVCSMGQLTMIASESRSPHFTRIRINLFIYS